MAAGVEGLGAVGGGGGDDHGELAGAEQADAVDDGHAGALPPGGGLGGDLGEDALGHGGIGFVLELDDGAAAGLVANLAGEGDHAAEARALHGEHHLVELERVAGHAEAPGAARDGRDERHFGAVGHGVVRGGEGLVHCYPEVRDEAFQRRVPAGELGEQVAHGGRRGQLDGLIGAAGALPGGGEVEDLDAHALILAAAAMRAVGSNGERTCEPGPGGPDQGRNPSDCCATTARTMAIPDFQTAMLPILKLAGDGAEHTLAEALESLARDFKTTEEERNQLLPSGRQRTLNNRVGWAKTYLQKAGLLESIGRGRFRITARGNEVLQGHPNRIDMKFLTRFPEYNAFAALRHSNSGQTVETPSPSAVKETTETPEEVLEESYQELRRGLADELLEHIKSCSPQFFEKLVVDLLVTMGYGGSRKDAGQAVGQSGDEGIDGIIKEDRLGLDVVYIQAKRWANTVGRPVVQAFAGSLEGQRARKGVLITTSDFSRESRDYVKHIEKKIVLIDGEELAKLMIDHGIGVTEVATYTVKKIDLDYFGDED